MDIKQLMANEAQLITSMFQKNNIRAKVDRRHSVCVETGYLSYALTLAMDERFARVEAMQRELSTVLGNARRRLRLPGDVQCIPVSFPRLALELPHPQPKPLLATNQALTSAKPHTMLAGRSYIEGPQDEYVVFDDTPHVLLAGITGAGKSVLLQIMLLSLAANTSPAECKFVLVDLKNEDLVPFEKLPHTLTFAGTRDAALDALRWVQAEKDTRVANRGYKPYRVVLVVDEMAQLAGNGEAKEILGDLASIGRGKLINLIGATQSVTKDGGMGSLLKANFTARLVGQVAPGQSQYATNRPHTRADLLPGKGAFLRCEGPHVYRFQSFYANEKESGEVTAFAQQINRMWGATVRHKAQIAPVAEPVNVAYQPPVVRDEIDQMVDAMRPHYHEGISKNSLSRLAFDKGFVGTSWVAKFNAAYERLINGASTQASTVGSTDASTTASTASTHTSESDTVASSSRSGNKIIRLPTKRTGTGGD